jgi:hypothetical protein
MQINDAIARIIELVRDTGGKVVFLENETLHDFHGIALQLRYNGNTNLYPA